MIKGDRLIINQKGISISNKRMEDIRVYPDSQVYLLPLKTFEYRPKESGAEFPTDIYLTPIPPEKWPFVMRFNIRLINRPGTFKKVYEFFEKLHINVLSSETIRSGHHHDTLNVLGEIRRLEVKSVQGIFQELSGWKNFREKIYQGVYEDIYKVNYVAQEQFETFKNSILKGLEETKPELKESEREKYFDTEFKKDFFIPSEPGGFYFEEENLKKIEEIYYNHFEKKLGYDFFENVLQRFYKEKYQEDDKKEFDIPMWLDIINAYTEKTEKHKNIEDFTKSVIEDIRKECENVNEFIKRFTGGKKPEEKKNDKKKITRKNEIQYADIIKKFREIEKIVEIPKDKEFEKKLWTDKINELESFFIDLKLKAFDYIEKEYEIKTKEKGLTGLISSVGTKIGELEKGKKNVDNEQLLNKLKSDKQMIVTIEIMTDPIDKTKFLKLELSPSLNKEDILKHLQDKLGYLYEKENEKDFNRQLGFYLAYRYLGKGDISIDELLEAEIKRAHPEVFKLAMNSSIKAKSKYLLIEKEMLILKTLLSLLVTYKKVLGYRYKLLLVEDSLKYAEDQRKANLHNIEPSDSYIYNIRYYRYIFQYPYFAERNILLSNKAWKYKILDIIEKLKHLPGERDREWPVDPRYSLEPITISAVEPLSHAFYHRVYEKCSNVTAEDSFIPFPPGFNPNLMNSLFPRENTSTYGIASFNSDTLSCRICPIPTSDLHRFVEIELEKNRNCHPDCVDNGRSYLKKFLKDREEEEEENEKRMWFIFEKDDSPPPQCLGSSMGLMAAWLDALGSPIDPFGEYGFNFNIWRTFNKTTRLDEEIEEGGITVWAQAIKKNFRKFPEDIDSRIKNEFEKKIGSKFKHKHLKGEKIKVNEFFSLRIFVSLPFDHPMRRQWFDYIKKVGKEEGFKEVHTTSTFTKPVTEEVAEDIRKSVAMIQILSLPDIKGGYQNSCGSQHLEWLYAEYLTAVTYKLKVIRLIDITTINDDEIRIGRDHFPLKFSRMEPFSDFEKNVKEAFNILKKELLDIYKI